MVPAAAAWRSLQRAHYIDFWMERKFVPGDLNLWLLTLTFKLARARDETRLACEFVANPFSGSGDISYTNKQTNKPKVTDSGTNRTLHSWLKGKGNEEYLYSAFLNQSTYKALRHGSHSFTCKQHHACLSFVAFTRCHHHSNCGSRHPIAAHYSFINPKRMKGWVGLVGWPIADGLPA